MIMIKKIVAVIMVFTLSACASLQEELQNYVKQPEVTYKSIAVGQVSMDLIELMPSFNISNQNNFSIPVNSVSYQLSLNEKKMLEGQSQEVGTLPANADKEVTLSIDLTQETLTSLQQLLFKDKKIDYQIKGSVNTLGVDLPFEKSATLYVPDIKVREMKVVNASFEQLDLLLSVDIDNKNDFSLPLEDVSYAVSSKGKALFDGMLSTTNLAEGSNQINIPVSIKPQDIFGSMFTLLLNPELPLHFEISTPLFTKSYDHSLNLTSFFL